MHHCQRTTPLLAQNEFECLQIVKKDANPSAKTEEVLLAAGKVCEKYKWDKTGVVNDPKGPNQLSTRPVVKICFVTLDFK